MPYSILFLGSQMAIGGAQRLLLQQAQWFQARGYQVEAVFLYDKEGLENQWNETYNLRLVNLRARRENAGWMKNNWLLLGGLWRAWRLMRKGHFDAILTYTHHSNFFVVIAWLAGIPVRAASHQGYILGFPRGLERLHSWVVNRFAIYLVAVSQRVQRESIQEGIRPDKIRLIQNGTSLPELKNFDRQALRRSLGIAENARLVVSVGRLTEQKAHTYLVQAAPGILEKHPDTHFAIAGDGPLREALQSEIRHAGLEGTFHLLGARHDIPQLLAAADIFALPSRWEGLPVALLEAMSLGLAAAATHVQGVEEVIKHGKTGLLVPLEDPNALAEAICDLLGDEPKRQQIAAAGQAYVREFHSLERMCQHYQSLLDPS